MNSTYKSHESNEHLDLWYAIVPSIIVVLLFSITVPTVNAIITEEESAARDAAEEKEKMNIQWNTYNNSEYGFSIKYPLPMGEPHTYFEADWSSDIPSVKNSPHLVEFYNYNNDENPYMTYINTEMNIYPADHFDKTLLQFMYEDFFGNRLDLPLGKPVTVTLDKNVSGYEFNTASNSRYLGFVHGNYIYVFGSEEVNTDIGEKLYNEMSNSIQLFDPTHNEDINTNNDITNDGNQDKSDDGQDNDDGED